ncbi:lysine 2,3-aminomutase [Pseudoclostridium thermosuccinogenes]|uniref:lysine 2,3-aminomutase n=1 Tax=Clostridium thermosuccinogenes TaxID=84032 RepID=UPI002FD8A482
MRKYTQINLWKNVSPRDWNDWKWQLRNRITAVEQLKHVLDLSESEQKDVGLCLKRFRMAITPYYATLIDSANPHCPIKAQCVPSINELIQKPDEKADPLNEDLFSLVPGIVHRYPDRVLFLITYKCSMYCRHCTRRRMVGEEDFSVDKAGLDRALEYIRSNKSIRDVLLSGGDPFVMPDSYLEGIISRLRAIPHVEVIRIGTRTPVVLPMRITDGLLGMLRKYHPIWINTHFNHPDEITPYSLQACQKIVDAGIPLGNQSVLLKGINDNVDVQKELLLKLVKARVRPYYLYQCDPSQGIGHFRTPVKTGVDIIKHLRGYISGYAVPTFVIDAPGGGGKVPINPEYVINMDDEKVVMRNYKGDIYVYP